MIPDVPPHVIARWDKEKVLWDAINAYAESCGGVTVSAARMDAVVAVTRVVENMETLAARGAGQCEAILAEQACPEGYLR